MEVLDQIIATLIETIIEYAPKVAGALITLVIGLFVISWLMRLAQKTLEQRQIDPTLARFATSVASVGLKVMLGISVLGMFGVEATSFVAVLGAAGLAVGMALSGTLQNFAGSAMILFFKPFKVGDFIEAQGHKGTVKEIQIFNTIMTTPDNKTIIIPNGGLANGSMVNYNQLGTRRVDFVFGIGYEDDIDKAKAIITEILTAQEKVMKEPAVQVVLSELADSSVNFAARAWVDAADYWPVYFYTMEAVKKRFDAEGVSIPFPQTDVHLHKVN